METKIAGTYRIDNKMYNLFYTLTNRNIRALGKHNTLEIVPFSRANGKYSVTLHHATI